MREFKLLINGKLVSGAATLDVINPATEEVLVEAPRADRAQLNEAIAAAKATFPAWSAKPIRERGALLVRLADALEARQDEFARLLTWNRASRFQRRTGRSTLPSTLFVTTRRSICQTRS
jgi:acyl-CoA reductase-like NAD-dependent aldehyde dehydrogenase